MFLSSCKPPNRLIPIALQIDVRATIREAKANLTGWSTNFSQLKVERKAGDAALKEMTQNVAARLDVKMRQSEFQPLLSPFQPTDRAL